MPTSSTAEDASCSSEPSSDEEERHARSPIAGLFSEAREARLFSEAREAPRKLEKRELELRLTLIELARSFLRCNSSPAMKSLVKALCRGQLTLTQFCQTTKVVFGIAVLNEAVRDLQLAHRRRLETSPPLLHHRPHVQMKAGRSRRGPTSQLTLAGTLTAELALMQRLTVSAPGLLAAQPPYEALAVNRRLAVVHEASSEA
jgi:hypothetical protein